MQADGQALFCVCCVLCVLRERDLSCCLWWRAERRSEAMDITCGWMGRSVAFGRNSLIGSVGSVPGVVRVRCRGSDAGSWGR